MEVFRVYLIVVFTSTCERGLTYVLAAEYARVSFADNSLIPLSVNASTNASTIIDYLFVSEIFATGWTVLDFAGFKPGDTVAVFDAGPVGLLAAYSAVLRGASKVYFIDHVQARLDLAKSIGAIPINFNETDPVERVLVLEPNGVTPSVDCAWYEAVNAQGESELGVVLRSMMNFTSDYGGVGVVGVYLGDETTTMSMTQFWRKALTMGSGIVLPLQHATLVTRDPANDSSNLRWTSCPYSGLSLGSQLECCNRVINTDCCSYRTSSSTPPPPYPPVAAAACALFLPGYFQNLSSSPI